MYTVQCPISPWVLVISTTLSLQFHAQKAQWHWSIITVDINLYVIHTSIIAALDWPLETLPQSHSKLHSHIRLHWSYTFSANSLHLLLCDLSVRYVEINYVNLHAYEMHRRSAILYLRMMSSNGTLFSGAILIWIPIIELVKYYKAVTVIHKGNIVSATTEKQVISYSFTHKSHYKLQQTSSFIPWRTHTDVSTKPKPDSCKHFLLSCQQFCCIMTF